MHKDYLIINPDISWELVIRLTLSSALHWVLICKYFTLRPPIIKTNRFTRFDCVFPTRTARFGVALISTGSIRLKSKEYEAQMLPVDPQCRCTTCRHYTRAALHVMFKENNPLASQLLTTHNVHYMMTLMRSMRRAIMQGSTHFEAFVKNFLSAQFPQGDVPVWVVDALQEAGIAVTTTLSREEAETSNAGEVAGQIDEE